ncbi:unnamed protein product [Caretta caretta]
MNAEKLTTKPLREQIEEMEELSRAITKGYEILVGGSQESPFQGCWIAACLPEGRMTCCRGSWMVLLTPAWLRR